MQEVTLQDAKRALASGVNRPLLAYFEARLEDAMQGLLMANEGSFKQAQGRVFEVQDFIKLLKSVRE